MTNDIFTKEDGEFLTKHHALERGTHSRRRNRRLPARGDSRGHFREPARVGGTSCRNFNPDILLLESGGDNLAACFSRELADYTIQVIDVAGGDKIPRKGGPGITQSDLLVINKTDLAEAVGADLEVMERDTKKMRGDGPFVFAQVKHGVGVDEIVAHVLHAWQHATGVSHKH